MSTVIRMSNTNRIRRALDDLSKDRKLHVKELGANYDGECYHIGDGPMWRNEYSLLALTLEPGNLLKYIEWGRSNE